MSRPMAWPTLADLARLPLPGTDGPIEVRFTPDGSALTYLAGDPGSQVRSLWRHDLASAERWLLAGPAAGDRGPADAAQPESKERGEVFIGHSAHAVRPELGILSHPLPQLTEIAASRTITVIGPRRAES